MDKTTILKEFQREPEKHWKVELFQREGFIRKICPSCGKGFWTLNTERQHCSDPNCGEVYGFIGDPITKGRWDLIETWKLFEKFFTKNNHILIQKYPIVSRWHPTLFFVVASIQDFMRYDMGKLSFEYPEHTLIVPQPCLRFVDIQNTGVTGKHHSCFIMPGQHSFNYPKEGYWKDKCVDLNFEFLTKSMEVPKEELVYIEDFWSMPDFSLFGPYLETHSRGLELVNSGFLGFQKSNGGYKELPIKVIDVGWGLERLCWFSNGTPTGYDVVFGPVVDKLKKICNVEYDKELFLRYAKLAGRLNLDEIPDIRSARLKVAKQLKVSVEELEKKVEELEALYAIADHTRALAFAIADAGLPSNVAGGYNLRVILRRALSFIDKFNFPIKLEDVTLWHANHLKKMFPELMEHEDDIVRILQIEEKRYRNTKERVNKIVESLAGRKVTEEELIKLYDSEGITPEQLGVEAPSDFYVKVTERHMIEKPTEEKLVFDVTQLPETKILYYNPVFEFKAKILKVMDDFVVLDQTAFYPRSGGQEPDFGLIDKCEIINVEKYGKVILHKVKECDLKEGQTVNCKVDKERRLKLTRHHTATHTINAAARKVLGNWVWQHSAFKDIDKARLDITHFEGLSENEVEKIEETANAIIEKDLPIKVEVLPRGKAEEKYGFTIYQGGAIPDKTLRIVSIGNIDVEACSGTHSLLKSTKDVGYISIFRTKRIQDGVDRVEFVAGDVALQNLKEKERILKEVAKKLKVKESEVPKAVEEMFKEWKQKRKQLK